MIRFLPLLLTVASAGKIQNWECGPQGIFSPSKSLAQYLLRYCHGAVQEFTNLCCKDHDFCYDMAKTRGYTRKYCDERFCFCLQDVRERTKEYPCGNKLDTFCTLASSLGESSFNRAQPQYHLDKLEKFVEKNPLGLEMTSLVNTCNHSRAIAIHCHNSVRRCTNPEEERRKRSEEEGEEEEEEEEGMEHSYEDCPSSMYDCLQTLIDSGASEECTAIARSLAKQVLASNDFAPLDAGKIGQSIIDTYPIVAARLLQKCTQSTNSLEQCFVSFDKCAVNNRMERPELYNAVRKIKIECHGNLSGCISEATKHENNMGCVEASKLATDLIREIDFHPEKTKWEKIKDVTATVVDSGIEIIGDAFKSLWKWG